MIILVICLLLLLILLAGVCIIPCLLARRFISKQQIKEINLSIDNVESDISDADLSTTVECSAPGYVFTEMYETVVNHEPLRHTAPGRMFRTSSFLLDGVSISGGTLGSLRVNILNQVLMRETRSRFNGISCTSLNTIDIESQGYS